MHHEADPLCVSGLHPAKRSRGAAPPLLLREERLLPPEKRKCLPSRVTEAAVDRFGLEQGTALPLVRVASLAVSTAPSAASSRCRPGAREKCDSQSNQASASACGETPAVNRAIMLRPTRSMVSNEGRLTTGDEGRGHGPGEAPERAGQRASSELARSSENTPAAHPAE